MAAILDKPKTLNSYYPHHLRCDLTDPYGVFVFGSNLRGVHGAGAARHAYHKYDAVYGSYNGFTGKAYAIPTKDEHIQTLPLERIAPYIEEFVRWTQLDLKQSSEPNWYLVTPIGTGLAGYRHEVIAPMFRGAVNCWFSSLWQPYLS